RAVVVRDGLRLLRLLRGVGRAPRLLRARGVAAGVALRRAVAARVGGDGCGLALGGGRPRLAALLRELGGRADGRLVRRRAATEVVERGDARPLLDPVEDALE